MVTSTLTHLKPYTSLSCPRQCSRRHGGGMQRKMRVRAESVEGGDVSVKERMEYINVDEGFSLARVSFGTILAPVGVTLMVSGFGAYFNFIPGGGISSLLLVYGFPMTLLGFALKYAELKPVVCKTTQEAFDLRETQMTAIQKQVREDTTRFRYGDDQHLEEALDRVFRLGRPGEVPRRSCPVLTGLREETRNIEGVAGPRYTLVLEFEAELTEEKWSAKINKFQSFFGPGILARLVTRENGADVELIRDGNGTGPSAVQSQSTSIPEATPQTQD